MTKQSKLATAGAKRYAVVDIGSNAVRLNMGLVLPDGSFLSETFTRIPLSLGRSSFSQQAVIRKPVQRRLVLALGGMRGLIRSMAPVAWRAVATAALRNARNGGEVVQFVRQECGVRIQVLSGEQEAAIIGRFVAAQFPAHRRLLNVDVGGGSSDCAIIDSGLVVAAETFAIGTVRAGGGEDAEKKRMQAWLAAHYPAGAVVCGSGGNVRSLVASQQALDARALQRWARAVAQATPVQIATQYGMSADHAARLDTTIAIYKLIFSITRAPLHPISGGLAEAVIRDLAAKRA